MATQRKVVGRAVALKAGEYVSPEGNRFLVEEGQTFDLVEGLEKSRWFEAVKTGVVPNFAKAKPPEDAPGAGPKRGSKVPKVDPSADDIA